MPVHIHWARWARSGNKPMPLLSSLGNVLPYCPWNLTSFLRHSSEVRIQTWA